MIWFRQRTAGGELRSAQSIEMSTSVNCYEAFCICRRCTEGVGSSVAEAESQSEDDESDTTGDPSD
jgi:hypothetical protein